MDQMKKYEIEVVDEIDIPAITKAKTLTSEGREDIDDAFFICDLGNIVEKHRRWVELFPRIHPFYAVKTCPYDPSLYCLTSLGGGFDCASKNEIKQVVELGADPQKIIFAHPCKQISHILHAKEQGVKMLVFDNELELVKMKENYPDAELVLRIINEKLKWKNKLSNKFGAPEDVARELLKSAKTKKLNVIGISYYTTCTCYDGASMLEFLEIAKRLFIYAEEVGFKFTLLDIGGGLSGTERTTYEDTKKVATTINDYLTDLFPTESNPNLKIISEPGQYYATSAFHLATIVTAKRIDKNVQVHDPNMPEKKTVPVKYFYYITDGYYGSLSFNVVEPNLKYFLRKESTGETLHASCIWGPTCQGGDVVLDNCDLAEMNIGDWMIWADMGAYRFAVASSFGGIKTTAFYNVISAEKLKLLQSLTKHGIERYKFIQSSYKGSLLENQP